MPLHPFLRFPFPESGLPGADTSNVNTLLMRQMALSGEAVTATVLAGILEKHERFLRRGGAGGHWRTLEVAGIVVGMYVGGLGDTALQAQFERRRLPHTLEFRDVVLPFSNFCGCYAKGVDFSGAELSHSLFTDAMLEDCDFSGTQLGETDFSRAVLRNANFSNAHIHNTDFENCDLCGADFSGTKVEGGKFAGADLSGCLPPAR